MRDLPLPGDIYPGERSSSMTGVASFDTLTRVNGPGRRALAEAVMRHRSAHGWSIPGMERRSGLDPETGKPRLKRGTIKNLENSERAVLERTLMLVDEVFEWEPDTARGILLETSEVPPIPRLARSARKKVAVVPRRLLAELEGRDAFETRTIIDGETRFVILALADDEASLDEIREALGKLDDLERKFRGME